MSHANTGLSLIAAGFLLIGAGGATAYERYNGGCPLCHGEFTDEISPLGTVFPSDSKHEMHRGSANMDTACNLCHTIGDGRDPFLGSSNGTATNAGVGCVGCHGREADAGNDNISPGRGAGLRQHHTNSGIATCGGCHDDAIPANYTPVDEDVLPLYYGTVDTLAGEPCNPDATQGINENWSLGDFAGLDNDGDLIYDVLEVVCLPEPTENVLLAAGIGALIAMARRRG